MTAATTQAPNRPSAPQGPAPVSAPKMMMPDAIPNAASRTVLVAVPGYGKTSIGAFADRPVMIVMPNELGYITLYRHELVPAVPVMMPRSWSELLACIESIARDPGDRKTLVLDALAGAEALLSSQICAEHFKGEWGEKGFGAFGRGAKIVMREWPAILPRLTACARKGVDVLLLAHSKVKLFSDPAGPNYDRYEIDMGNDEAWSRTRMWSEAVMYGIFQPIVDQARPEANTARAKGKAIAQNRILRTENSPICDAKCQLGLEPVYTMPNSAAECAAAYWALVKGTK